MSVILPVTAVAALLFAMPALIRAPFQQFKIFPWAVVSSFVLSPGTATIGATTPNTTGTAIATGSWIVNLGASLVSNWTLGVSALTPSCTTAPLSSITVKCTAITDSGITTAVHTCALPFALSTTAQTLASGADSIAIVNGHRSISIQYSFADTFKYTATSTPCNVNLTYVLSAM